MTRKAGIVAAFPMELKPLVREWRRINLPRGDIAWQGRIGSSEPVDCVAVAAGMGSESAERACRIAESLLGGLDILVSVGFAGSLSCGLEAGVAYSVARVIDQATGEGFSTIHASPPFLTLVTANHVAGRAEKLGLRDYYQAVLVDMEAAAVGRIAANKSIDFCCIKAASDGIDDELPDFSRFRNGDGKLHKTRTGLDLALRPRYWSGLVKLGKNSKVGAVAIARATNEFFEQGRQ